MTTKADWEFRAEYLRHAAMRLDLKAEELKSEAEGLRKAAADCDEEVARLNNLSK